MPCAPPNGRGEVTDGILRIMMNAEGDDASYDPNAAAELFFAQQKARDEARSKLPTDEWILAISRIMEAKTNIKDDNDDDRPSTSSASFSSPKLLLSRLVTTMPPPPLNDSDGMMDLNTADTFIISSANIEEKNTLTSDVKVARRRIIEYLVQQLEMEMLPVTTSEKEMNVEEVNQAR